MKNCVEFHLHHWEIPQPTSFYSPFWVWSFMDGPLHQRATNIPRIVNRTLLGIQNMV